jgi:hypothetical protein
MQRGKAAKEEEPREARGLEDSGGGAVRRPRHNRLGAGAAVWKRSFRGKCVAKETLATSTPQQGRYEMETPPGVARRRVCFSAWGG